MEELMSGRKQMWTKGHAEKLMSGQKQIWTKGPVEELMSERKCIKRKKGVSFSHQNQVYVFQRAAILPKILTQLFVESHFFLKIPTGKLVAQRNDTTI